MWNIKTGLIRRRHCLFRTSQRIMQSLLLFARTWCVKIIQSSLRHLLPRIQFCVQAFPCPCCLFECREIEFCVIVALTINFLSTKWHPFLIDQVAFISYRQSGIHSLSTNWHPFLTDQAVSDLKSKRRPLITRTNFEFNHS